MPQEHLKSFAAAQAIPFLDLLPALRSQAEATKERFYLPVEGHLNDAGHRIIGEEMAEFVRRLEL